ncbi:MAG TPA: cupin domain-containing protein [Acidimicrobiales bacterium]|nr:cupin domain-containing protein [Acidimicrobiales bacterium]
MLESKNIDTPDEKVGFDHGDLQIVNLTGATVVRATFRPGWSWSGDVRPRAGTPSCQMPHSGIVLSGRFVVRMDDGEERILGPGDAHVVSPGHDAWVMGDEPCVILDFSSAGADAS